MFIKVKSSRLSSRSRKVIKKDLVVRGWVARWLACKGKKFGKRRVQAKKEQRVDTRTRKNREKITRFGSVKSVNCEPYWRLLCGREEFISVAIVYWELCVSWVSAFPRLTKSFLMTFVWSMFSVPVVSNYKFFGVWEKSRRATEPILNSTLTQHFAVYTRAIWETQ